MAIVFTRKKINFKKIKDVFIVIGVAIGLFIFTVALRYLISFMIKTPLPSLPSGSGVVEEESVIAPNIDWDFLEDFDFDRFIYPGRRVLLEENIGRKIPFSSDFTEDQNNLDLKNTDLNSNSE